jgi:hypothetical protein
VRSERTRKNRDSGAREKGGREVVDRRTSHAYGTMALISRGGLEVNGKETRPAFGLEAHKIKGGKGAPAKVHWPLYEAGAHVFMQLPKTSTLK